MTQPADPAERLSARAKRVMLAGIVLGSVLLLLVAADIYVRITSPIDDLWALTGRSVGSNPIADWAFVDAFAAYRGRPGRYPAGTGFKTVDSAGFISTPEIRAAKPANTIRIAFLGESSTAGTGILLRDSLTWPWLVAEQLRSRPGRQSQIEFINAAMGGYTTFESYGRLWSRLRFFAPDIVVVYHGWNEIYYFNRVDRMDRWRTLRDGSWGLETAVPVTVYAPRWFDWLVRRSQLLTKVRLRLSAPLNGEASAGVFTRELVDTFDYRALEIFRTNLRLFRSTSAQLGMELFVGKQATLIAPDLPKSEQRRSEYWRHSLSHDGHVAAFREMNRVIDEEIPSDRIIDATPLSGVPENFYDHVHPTPLGAQRTATIMADALEPWVAARENALATSNGH